MAGQIATDRNDPAQQQSALLPIALFVVAKVIFHTFMNSHYGFHRDELALLDDARRLAWGYVAYPPLTPFFGRLSLMLFGTSLAGFRLIASVAAAIAPISLAASSLMQYVSFDYLWYVLLAYFVVRLSRGGDPRWWL